MISRFYSTSSLLINSNSTIIIILIEGLGTMCGELHIYIVEPGVPEETTGKGLKEE